MEEEAKLLLLELTQLTLPNFFSLSFNIFQERTQALEWNPCETYPNILCLELKSTGSECLKNLGNLLETLRNRF